MNEVLLRMRSGNKPVQPESPYLHLFLLLIQKDYNDIMRWMMLMQID